MQATFRMQKISWIIFLLWYINLWAVLCVNIVHRTMWWDVPSKKRPTYISPERGVRRCEDVALYCWWWKTKWAIRLSTRLSPSNNPDPPTPSWTSPRVLYEITTCTTSKSIRIQQKYTSQKNNGSVVITEWGNTGCFWESCSLATCSPELDRSERTTLGQFRNNDF